MPATTMRFSVRCRGLRNDSGVGYGIANEVEGDTRASTERQGTFSVAIFLADRGTGSLTKIETPIHKGV